MSHKKIIGILLLLSIVGITTGYFFLAPCDPDRNYLCEGPYAESMGQPIFSGSMALTLIFIILIFLPKPYFTAWGKFAIWFVPLAVLWIIMTPTRGGSGLGFGLNFDRELAIMWSSGLYITISLLILGIKAVRQKGNKQIDSDSLKN